MGDGLMVRTVDFCPLDGRYLRQPLYVGDFCDIVMACIARRPAGAYNISGLERIDYIDLMRAVKEKRLAVDSLAFETHIDRCLGCRACESACPAGVEYGQLLEAARAEIVQGQAKPTGLYRLLYLVLRHIWSRPGRLRAAFAFARLMRDSGDDGS